MFFPPPKEGKEGKEYTERNITVAFKEKSCFRVLKIFHILLYFIILIIKYQTSNLQTKKKSHVSITTVIYFFKCEK